jgi:hypothetical protein
LHCGGCEIYFPTILEFDIIVSKSLWKICWRLCGIVFLLANEGCVMVGCSLVINVYNERSHRVAKGGKDVQMRCPLRGFRKLVQRRMLEFLMVWRKVVHQEMEEVKKIYMKE